MILHILGYAKVMRRANEEKKKYRIHWVMKFGWIVQKSLNDSQLKPIWVSTL